MKRIKNIRRLLPNTGLFLQMAYIGIIDQMHGTNAESNGTVREEIMIIASVCL